MAAPLRSNFIVAGIMSGTSLDGTDIALCRFDLISNKWKYSVVAAETYPYSDDWRRKLIEAETCSGRELLLLHKEYGRYLGGLVNNFLKEQHQLPGIISSHGHTIFHQPEKRLTFQLGDGACIAAITGITTISDFRNLDVALGGQGAPLVPVGDELLFGDYDQCLNLGGFANVSYRQHGIRKAFDICPVNIVLNYLTRKYFDQEYDKNGVNGRSGKIDPHLLEKLDNLGFFKEPPPKSLGKEWILHYMLPEIEKSGNSPYDKLRTVYENIAVQLSANMNALPGERILITGGGAYNDFLLECLKGKTRKDIILPGKEVIEFKEALIFAFLGMLRYLNMPNCLASVTGAQRDNSGGIIHFIR